MRRSSTNGTVPAAFARYPTSSTSPQCCPRLLTTHVVVYCTTEPFFFSSVVNFKWKKSLVPGCLRLYPQGHRTLIAGDCIFFSFPANVYILCRGRRKQNPKVVFFRHVHANRLVYEVRDALGHDCRVTPRASRTGVISSPLVSFRKI